MASPTELFEKIAHPMRIRILKMLEASPMTFSRLRNELGLSSSGNLDFHLKKLEGLVVLDSDGLYRLSEEGKEALVAVRIVEASAVARSTPPSSQIRWVLAMCGTFITVFISAVIITVVFLGVPANSSIAMVCGLVGGLIGGGIGGLYSLWKGMRIEGRKSRPLSYWPTKSTPWQMGDWTAQAIFIGGQLACAYCSLYAWLKLGLQSNFLWACISFSSLYFVVLGAGFVSQRIIAKANKLIGQGSSPLSKSNTAVSSLKKAGRQIIESSYSSSDIQRIHEGLVDVKNFLVATLNAKEVGVVAMKEEMKAPFGEFSSLEPLPFNP